MSEQPSLAFNDGASIPQLGLGVWKTAPDEAPQVMRTAVAAGYRMVDTAAIYGNEAGVGEGLRDSPEVFLTTKLWNDRQGYDSALRAFDESLARLGRDSVNLYLIHWPRPDLDRYVDSWRALIRLKQEGRARSIGVSNFGPDYLERLIGETGVVPALNQIELHPRFQQKRLREFHARHGIVTQSWSPLGQGALLADPTLAALAQKHGKSPAQIIIRWHLDQGLAVIPKSSNPDRLRENIAVFDFRLDAEDLAVIDAMDRADGRVGPDPVTARF